MAAHGAPATMRLRVRASTGGPTIKLQVPLLCTLQGFKDLLGLQIAIPANSLSVSLNKEDEIQGPGAALLSSFGITSGDLVFYGVMSHRHPSPYGREPQPHPSGQSDEVQAARRARGSDREGAAALEAIGRPGSVGAGRGGRATGGTIAPRRVLGSDGSAGVVAGRSVSLEHLEQGSRIDLPSSSSTGGYGEAIEVDNAKVCGRGEANSADNEEFSLRNQGRGATPEGPRLISGLPTLHVIKSGSFESLSGKVLATGRDMVTVNQFDDKSRLSSQSSAGYVKRERGEAMSTPDVLRSVLAGEIGNVRRHADYLILAAHAVMLDTGLTIRFGNKENTASYQNKDESAFVEESSPHVGNLEGYGLPPGWNDGAGPTNFTYALSSSARRKRRDAISSSPSPGPASITAAVEEIVLLRCQIVGDFVIIYGIVSGGSTHRLCLSVAKYLRKRPDMKTPAGEIKDNGDESLRNGENEFCNLSEFWREVKDNLSLPLLTSLCENIGIPPPPSLVRLPTELKIKVLDCLPSLDLARFSCVCSDFRAVSSHEDLWRQKFKEQFGSEIASKVPVGSGWKTAFVKEFEKWRRHDGRRDMERMFRNEASFAVGRHFGRRPTGTPYFGAGIDRYFHRTDAENIRESSVFGTMFGTNFPNLGGRSADCVGLPGLDGGLNISRCLPGTFGSSSLFSNQFLSPDGDGVCLPFQDMSPTTTVGMQLPSWNIRPPTTTEETAVGGRVHHLDTLNTRTLDDIYGGMSSLNTSGAGRVNGGLATSEGMGSFYGRGRPIGDIGYNERQAVPGPGLAQDGRHLAGGPSFRF